MQDDDPEELEEERLAAAEAAAIGGRGGIETPEDPVDTGLEGEIDPAMVPVYEAGGGEAEGFEEAEELLIEHASHGDQQSAHAVIRDAGPEEEADPERADGEPDHELSSEREDEEPPGD